MFCGKAVKPIYEFMSSFLFQFKPMMTLAQLLLFLFYSTICHHCDKFLPGEESLGPNIFHHISTHENISSCKNILLIINWCGGLVLVVWPVWWRPGGRRKVVVVVASPEDWPPLHWGCWGQACQSSGYTGELQWSSQLWQTSPSCSVVIISQ